MNRSKMRLALSKLLPAKIISLTRCPFLNLVDVAPVGVERVVGDHRRVCSTRAMRRYVVRLSIPFALAWPAEADEI
jgi:hypothetical protein